MDTYQYLELIQNLIKGKGFIPKIAYQKEPFQESHTDNPLPRKNCLFHICKYRSLWELFYHLQNIEGGNLHSLMVVEKGNVIFERFVSPYKKTYRHASYSLCKSIVSMGIGLAYDDGLIQLDSKVSDIVDLPKFTHKSLKALTIRHLLTMQAGVEFHEFSQAYSDNYFRDYFKSRQRFQPGEDFYYNSMNSYILCAILVELYQMPVLQLLNQRIFSKLDIYDITWDVCPLGIEKGGFGMKLSLEDMAKLGLLWLQKGAWLDKKTGEWMQIVSKEYVNLATQIHVKRMPVGYDYGLHMWVLDDAILFNGMLGQNIFIYPKKELVIVTQGGMECFVPTRKLVQHVDNYANCVNELPIKILCKRILEMHKNTYSNQYKKLNAVMDRVVEKKYLLKEPILGVIPFAMQLVYQIQQKNLTGISFDSILEEGIPIHFYSEDTCITIAFGLKEAKEQFVTVDNQQYPVAAQVLYAQNEDYVDVLKLKINYLEEANTRIYSVYLHEDRILVKADELPSLPYLYQTVFVDKKLIPVNILERCHDNKYFANWLQNFLKPSTYGFEIS